MNFLRFLTLLAISVWLGALTFFPVVAAIAFAALPSAHLAGLVVRSSLVQLHWVGFVCGAVFLACSLICDRIMRGRAHAISLSNFLIALMLALTAISQFRIIPRMETLRAAAGPISLLAPRDPIRIQFESLHLWSMRVEGTVIVLGIILLYLTSRRLASARP